MDEEVRVGEVSMSMRQHKILKYMASRLPIPTNRAVGIGVNETERTVKEDLAKLYLLVFGVIKERRTRGSLIEWFRRQSQEPPDPAREVQLIPDRDSVVRKGSRLACALASEDEVADPVAWPMRLVDSPLNRSAEFAESIQVETPTMNVLEIGSDWIEVHPGPDVHANWRSGPHEHAGWWHLRKHAAAPRFIEDIGGREVPCSVMSVNLDGGFDLNCPAYDEFLDAAHEHYERALLLTESVIREEASSLEWTDSVEGSSRLAELFEGSIDWLGPSGDTEERRRQDREVVVDAVALHLEHEGWVPSSMPARHPPPG